MGELVECVVMEVYGALTRACSKRTRYGQTEHSAHAASHGCHLSGVLPAVLSLVFEIRVRGISVVVRSRKWPPLQSVKKYESVLEFGWDLNRVST